MDFESDWMPHRIGWLLPKGQHIVEAEAPWVRWLGENLFSFSPRRIQVSSHVSYWQSSLKREFDDFSLFFFIIIIIILCVCDSVVLLLFIFYNLYLYFSLGFRFYKRKLGGVCWWLLTNLWLIIISCPRLNQSALHSKTVSKASFRTSRGGGGIMRGSKERKFV